MSMHRVPVTPTLALGTLCFVLLCLRAMSGLHCMHLCAVCCVCVLFIAAIHVAWQQSVVLHFSMVC